MRKLIGILILATFFIGFITIMAVNIGLKATLCVLGISVLILGAICLFLLAAELIGW